MPCPHASEISSRGVIDKKLVRQKSRKERRDREEKQFDTPTADGIGNDL
jgi:hypothetical protein